MVPSVRRVRARSASDAEPILRFGEGDNWTISDSFEGTQIFGATGSGKTSGSGQEIALSLLDADFGGLVLTVKSDELDTWRSYARHTGRQEDLIIFGPNVSPERPFTFNFLEYERRANADSNVSLTDNLVALFSTVMEVAQKGNKAANQDAYWLLTMKQLLRNSIDLLLYASKPLTFRAIYEVIVSAPQSPQIALSESWKRDSLCWDCLSAVEDISSSDSHFDDALLTHTYWLREFPGLAPETRSIIVSVFTSMADCFLRGALKTLFSAKDLTPQLEPELSHAGAIVIIDLPVKQFYEVGQFAQVLYKFIWQRAAERRADKSDPVFLWADEAQFFINSKDMPFQTTARSSRVSTVYLTQSISNYYAVMPGETGKAEVDALLGNLRTKVFHANEDPTTNLWAADLIGKKVNTRLSRSASVTSGSSTRGGSGSQFTSSQQEVIEHQILPVRFNTLRQGGDVNDMTVDAIVTKGGRMWSNDKNFHAVQFKQKQLLERQPRPRSFAYA